MNRVIMIGRLTRDPECKEISSQNGKFQVANFDIAVRRNTTDVTDFFHVKAFNKLSDIAEKYLRKGMKVLVEGELLTSSYTDKDTGKKKTSFEISATRIEFVESKSGNENDGSTRNYPPPTPADYDGFSGIPEGYDENLPFK